MVNAYLEDWSNGVRDSFDYVFAMVTLLRDLGTRRVYLADTLGIMSPQDVTRYVELMVSTWPDLVFEFHAHNDYGLAAANTLASVRAGARGVHTSVNGLGERTGNARLAEVVAAIHDHTKFQTGVQEARLSSLSRLVETFSGKDVADNTPIVGRDVYTQTAGIHADGDAKGELYASRLLPARFGERRRYALGKLAGKASLEHNLKALGIALGAEEKALVLQRIVEIGERKNRISIEDLPYIIADVLKSPADQRVRVESYRVVVGTNETPQAEIVLAYRNKKSTAKANGSGGYDAFMNAIRKAARKLQLEVPRLADFRVRIPPGGPNDGARGDGDHLEIGGRCRGQPHDPRRRFGPARSGGDRDGEDAQRGRSASEAEQQAKIGARSTITPPRASQVRFTVELPCAGWLLGWGDGRPSGSNPMSPSGLPPPHPRDIALDRAALGVFPGWYASQLK